MIGIIQRHIEHVSEPDGGSADIDNCIAPDRQILGTLGVKWIQIILVVRAIVIGVLLVGVGAAGVFLGIGQAVAVAVESRIGRIFRIQAVRNLPPIRDAVAIGVGRGDGSFV